MVDTIDLRREIEALIRQRIRRLVPGGGAVLLAVSLFFVTQAQVATAGQDEVASRYHFQELPIALPAGYDRLPQKTLREVNPAYEQIRSWISSVGAGIAINDLTGHGRADSMCLVDTRTDKVVVTYTPTAPAADRFDPFLLDPAPRLAMDSKMAPMGCAPGDFNSDGRMDLLVYYWGRTPVLFLAKADAVSPSPSAYQPQELVPADSTDGSYRGPRWNTNAVGVADYDGDGHPDIYVGNYFPDSDVLDPDGQNNVQMNSSLSSANNGGGNRVLRWRDATSGPAPTAAYVEDRGALPYETSTGWTLAVSQADLTGTGMPDVYVANDFGHDFLLHNVSSRGRIKFQNTEGTRTATTPKSFVLGNDSFKGMGIDFTDLDRRGRFDMVVSNITTAWGLEESNFVWSNQEPDEASMKRSLDSGVAPFTQDAQQHGMAWTGWGWDLKSGDFLNSGDPEIVQTEGFVKGTVDRWPWLQELAMSNDTLLSNPQMWPHIRPGDDIAGSQPIAFYAKGADGKLVDVSRELGLAVPIPTRGVATGDTTGTGVLDFAVARQWGPPAFYRNLAPRVGNYLDLRLYRPADGSGDQGLLGTGTPAYGATVRVTTADGRSQVSQLDGGGGHGGKRSFEVHFGLGDQSAPVTVQTRWRDVNGALHQQERQVTPGTHTYVLSDTVQEVPNR